MRSSLRRALAGAAAVLLTATLAPSAAVADPPLTVEEAKQQVDDLNTQAAAVDQDYAGVQDKIAKGKKQLAQTQADVKVQQIKVAALRKAVGQVALAQFQNSSLDTTAQLFLRSDTQTFLNQVSTVEKVNENQNSALQKLQTEQGNLASLERSAATDLTTLRADEKNLATLRANSDAKVDAAKQILAKLTAEERARLAALEKARQKEAAAAAAEASAAEATATNETTSTESTASATDPASDDAPAAPSGSGKGATALAFAKNQLGKPYSFGAAGPNAYDCSGLTSAAWKAAGVSISRTSQTQYHDGTAVSRDDLQPGDLVFFYPPAISHVALYAGNGTVIHAPHAGSSVQYIKMSYMPYAGARRPG